jgi:peptidoglycan/xylan/chitin deacetylase (PgdA/CDA1 family)
MLSRRSAGWRSRATAAVVPVLLVSVASTTVAHAEDPFVLHVPVLMYHRIRAAPPDAGLPELWVSPRRFRAQLAALSAAGWQAITAEELARALHDRRRPGRRRFVITIDDGARDGYRNAAPVLADLGMVATYCVTPGRAGRAWQLSFRHMRRLRTAGHEIANHSLTHADLSSLSTSGLKHQVMAAHRLIAERVGHEPRTMCYPYGRQDAPVRRLLRRAGYLLAFTTVYGARESTLDPLRSPRIRVNGSDGPASLLRKLRPYRGASPEEAAPRRVRSMTPTLPR